ncbi:uncharacterized protein [Amphiura filiformis]|uniref:uncharacterized protein n=1 Tax=Amphiura filiformis TaxID=82378 RepID=UPI003B219366
MSSDEWSSSSRNMESSSTAGISAPNVYFQNGTPFKAPVPCTSDLRQHITDCQDVDNNHYEVSPDVFNNNENQYTALNCGAGGFAIYNDQILNAGETARARRASRNSRTFESDIPRVRHLEPEVKLRRDAPRSLRSREDSVYSHDYAARQQMSRSQEHSAPDAQRPLQRPSGRQPSVLDIANFAKPLRSKENLYLEYPPRYYENSGMTPYYLQPIGPCDGPLEPKTSETERKYSTPYESSRRRASPPLPARDGITNHASLRRFVENKRQDNVTITFQESDLQGGKRLHLANIRGSIWICSWESTEGIALEQQLHPGDELIKVNDIKVQGRDAKFVYNVLSSLDTNEICLTLKRAPHATALIVDRQFPDQSLGITVENNIIKKISASGAFGSSTTLSCQTTGVINAGTLVDWAITEINWQPLNFYANTTEVEALLQKGKKEVALVVQPSDLVQAMKEAATLCSRCGTPSSPPSSPKCNQCRHNFKSTS